MSKRRKLFSSTVTGTKIEVSAVGISLGVYHLVNLTATLNYIQMFNSPAAGVTVGTTVPHLSIPLPGDGGATLPLDGLFFSNGLTIACTTDHNNSTTSSAFVVLTATM